MENDGVEVVDPHYIDQVVKARDLLAVQQLIEAAPEELLDAVGASAARYGNVEALRVVIERCDTKSWSLFEFVVKRAAQLGHISILELMVSKNLVRDASQAATWALVCNQPGALKFVLQNGRVNLEAKVMGGPEPTRLLLACARSVKLVQVLLEAGADFLWYERGKKGPLEVAYYANRTDCIRLLKVRVQKRHMGT
jgi:hypothetical protein